MKIVNPQILISEWRDLVRNELAQHGAEIMKLNFGFKILGRMKWKINLAVTLLSLFLVIRNIRLVKFTVNGGINAEFDRLLFFGFA